MITTSFAHVRAAIRAARNLEDLRAALIAAEALDDDDQAELATGLPTFGGDDPGYDATFSWDAERVLQYDDSIRPDGQRIGWVIGPCDD